MSGITFTKKIGLFQQFLYKFEKDSGWARRADIDSLCFINVSIREKYNSENEFIRNELYFETFLKQGHSVCKAISDDKEAYDAQFFEEKGLTKFWLSYEGSVPAYVHKIYDVMETKGFKEQYLKNKIIQKKNEKNLKEFERKIDERQHENRILALKSYEKEHEKQLRALKQKIEE